MGSNDIVLTANRHAHVTSGVKVWFVNDRQSQFYGVTDWEMSNLSGNQRDIGGTHQERYRLSNCAA